MASSSTADASSSTGDAADKERLAEIHREQASLIRQLEQLQQEEVEIKARVADRKRRSQQQAVQVQAEPPEHWSQPFEWDGALRELVSDTFGHDAFRPLQKEVINACLSGVDVFAVMPTGAGKSLCSWRLGCWGRG